MDKLKKSLLYFIVCIFFLQTVQISLYAGDYSADSIKNRFSNSLIMQLGSPTAYYNLNQKTQIDPKNSKITPILKDNSVLVPIRFISEIFKFSTTWEKSTKSIVLKQQGKIIKLSIGKSTIINNGKTINISGKPQNINSTVYVPIRAISDAFGKKVFFQNDLIIVSNTDNIINKYTEIYILSTLKSLFNITNPVQVSKKPNKSIKDIASLEKSVVVINSFNKKGDQISLGSGFCVAPGLFLTNFHVVEGGSSFKLQTFDNKEYQFDGLVSVDIFSDLALLKAKQCASIIKPLSFGATNKLVKGDEIVTIGNPDGLQNTISTGIISGLRAEEGINLIQITAPITHGSSGGPLFNMKGEVIGINSMGKSDGNLNFAISGESSYHLLLEAGNTPFDKIKSGIIDEIMEKDDKISDEDLFYPVTSSFEAIKKKDVEKYLSFMYTAGKEISSERKKAITDWFNNVSMNINIVKMSVVTKSSEESIVYYIYQVDTTYKNEKKSSFFKGYYYLLKEKGTWKVSLIKEEPIEYLPDGTKLELTVPSNLTSNSAIATTSASITTLPSDITTPSDISSSSSIDN